MIILVRGTRTKAVDEEVEILKLIAICVDGIITNHPDKLIALKANE